MQTAGLLGRKFKHGEHDCFSLMREFYATNFGIQVPDVARPNDWWEPDAEGKTLNLYLDLYHEVGFGLFTGHPRNRLPGDVILMAIRSPVANHGAILLPGEMILHHLAGQVSTIESYNRPLFRDTTVAVLRHPEVDGAKLVQETEIDAWDLVPQRVRDQLEEARQGRLDV
ncbi:MULTISPECIES: NlpC/P60 family protein [unclassified Methylobacterium]|uniref:NlpC/P60 family protein n=1 Tax=unclassified Methylobacterium TaxID=2615210 RepID=UPI0011C1D76B|nr:MULTISPECIES: NlpC/P60 family protein [unclassified Methylobacterium]QEE37934.1 NlpC/P60 family protein [Methylobacterium sp. WL1]TXN59360.1 NlpC/P60 family protein [Methylobacterium sp. WL2]